ncbi:MAG: thermonuclease family protein [Rhizobiaceae bacterium]
MFVFLFGLAFVSAWFANLATDKVSGQAVAIDGDSLRIAGREIRLYGLDAPEYRQLCNNTQNQSSTYPCGKIAASMLRRMAEKVTTICEGHEVDKYDRLLAVCTADGIELNREMVLQGWAVSFGDYENEEAQAKQNGVGLWAGKFDLPSDWRREEGRQHESDWLKSLFQW